MLLWLRQNVSSRTLEQRLQDILEQAEEIIDFADGLDFESFCIEQIRELIDKV